MPPRLDVDPATIRLLYRELPFIEQVRKFREAGQRHLQIAGRASDPDVKAFNETMAADCEEIMRILRDPRRA